MVNEKEILRELQTLTSELNATNKRIKEIYEDEARYGKSKDKSEELEGLLEDQRALSELIGKKRSLLNEDAEIEHEDYADISLVEEYGLNYNPYIPEEDIEFYEEFKGYQKKQNKITI